MQDLLARGLAELGHQVLYFLPGGCAAALPDGVELAPGPVADIDIYQTISAQSPAVMNVTEFVATRGLPWIMTCHLDRSRSDGARPPGDNWIFVAHALARSYGKDRHVLNGIDPTDCYFSRTKEDFLLFMATAENAITKGLDTAIAVSRRSGIRLVVAGTGRSYEAIDRLAAMCSEARAEYLGDIRGTAKAERLAAAKAVLLPTRANEGCPLTLIEALMSGTPVIAAPMGGIPEMMSSDIGFLCASEDECVAAVERLDKISPDRCREYAIERFHYLRMARDYVKEFELEIGG
jgi:glycosyltransferase involved in cell wall biosynthesis